MIRFKANNFIKAILLDVGLSIRKITKVQLLEEFLRRCYPVTTDIGLTRIGENTDGGYIAFAFQQKDQAAVKNVKAGDSVSIKGSCNGAGFSSILGVPYITFKRCSLNK